MRAAALALAGITSLGALASCRAEAPSLPAGDADAWRARLLRIAASFPALGRVDDGGRMSPVLCAAPMSPRARYSASSDEATHGQKVYSIFAKDPETYRVLTGVAFRRAREEAMDVDGTEGCSQVLVKEAYEPVELTPGNTVRGAWTAVDEARGPLQPIEPAAKDGKLYGAGKRAGLFVMFRLDPKAEATDDGWVYGTVSADATTVTSVGRVASCMGCHEKAPHGRLFGLPK